MHCLQMHTHPLFCKGISANISSGTLILKHQQAFPLLRLQALLFKQKGHFISYTYSDKKIPAEAGIL